MFTELTCNIIMRMVTGKRYYGEDVDSEEAKLFQKIMRGIFELAGFFLYYGGLTLGLGEEVGEDQNKERGDLPRSY
ncbi:hypothetical protein AAG906_023889 [Vitis piasezkii]